jgi:prepilin-type N-terminal cleavage/methylation domain-containing protein
MTTDMRKKAFAGAGMKKPRNAARFGALRSDGGYSLVELIIVLVLVGILAGVIGFSVKDTDEKSRLAVASNNALANLRFAQQTAMSESADVNFVVNSGTNSYYSRYAVSARYPGGDYLKSPTDPTQNLSVTLNQGQSKGVSITSGYAGVITFNSDGIPYYSGGGVLTGEVTLMTLNSKASLVLEPSGYAEIR